MAPLLIRALPAIRASDARTRPTLAAASSITEWGLRQFGTMLRPHAVTLSRQRRGGLARGTATGGPAGAGHR
ncbi:hypothetical protein NORO109296_25155 [Nocardiopsis rhodophaea]